MTAMLLIGAIAFVRSWWERVLWIVAIVGSHLLGYFGFALLVVMLILMAVKEVAVGSDNAASVATVEFSEEPDGRIVATDRSSGQVTVYGSVDEMPLHIHAHYLKQSRRV